MAIPLILVAPGLLEQPRDVLARVASLEALASVATVEVAAQGTNTLVLDALGIAPGMPIGPLLARGAGIDIDRGYAIVADPVLLAADRDDLVLVDRVDDLTTDESSGLVAMLNRHFAEDGMHFIELPSSTWIARVDRAPALQTTSLDVARRRGVFPHLPTGPDARTWRRWQNEIQMLLHNHPVNVAREAHGRVPVTGVWFWGGGRADAIGTLPPIAAMTARNRLGDIVRAIARLGGGTHRELGADATVQGIVAASSACSRIVTVDARIDAESALARFDAERLAPALSLLARGAVDPLHVIADRNSGAARWTGRPRTGWQRLTARAHRKSFTVPDELGR
jgi:hypothetical protein